MDRRTDISGISIEPGLMSYLHVAKQCCEATRRADERACHSIARLEVQYYVVVVDMWDKDWAIALRSSSLMFWL